MVDLSDVPYKELQAELRRRNIEAWSVLEVPWLIWAGVFFMLGHIAGWATYASY